MKKLPYGGQTFQEIIDENFLYKAAVSGPKLALRAARRAITAITAMARIKERGYAERYLQEGRILKLVGGGHSPKNRCGSFDGMTKDRRAVAQTRPNERILKNRGLKARPESTSMGPIFGPGRQGGYD
jgi:hypothetical protein